MRKRLVVSSLPWEVFVGQVRRKALGTHWAMFFVDEPANAEEELKGAWKRKGSLRHIALQEAIEVVGWEDLDGSLLRRLSEIKTKSPRIESLTVWELRSAMRYIDSFGTGPWRSTFCSVQKLGQW